MGEAERTGEGVTIRFGTSGWRGVLGEDVDFAALRALTAATAHWLREQSPHRGVLLGYDTRFASRWPRLDGLLVDMTSIRNTS